MNYTILHADCFDWLAEREENSITSVVTDPPYGIKEYSENEIVKQRLGKGGIWRRPPAYDGYERQALPRFSVINDEPRERKKVYKFFKEWGKLVLRVLAPGGHVFVASTPLLSDLVSSAMRAAGFERRGEIIRTVVTLRGGDRPKGGEADYPGLSVIPKGMWEPWGLYRKPLSEKTVARNLKKWGAGALKRKNNDVPFRDLIQSQRTPKAERDIAPHPSLKPQLFLRELVYASLPLCEGFVLDTFAGSGSTLAAAESLGYSSIGIERDREFYKMATDAISKLADLYSGGNRISHKKEKRVEWGACRQASFDFLQVVGR